MPALHTFIAATSFPRDQADWKGRFIFDQAAAMARIGMKVTLWAPPGDLPSGVASGLREDDGPWLDDLMQQGGIAHLLRQSPLRGALAGWSILRRLNGACRPAGADFYLINWLQNALALPDDRRPALVTVLGSDFRLLDLPGMAAALRFQFRRRKTALLPNADWMVKRLTKLFGDVATVECNPFGVNADWFNVRRAPAAEACGWVVVSRITRAKLGPLIEWGEGLFSADRPLHLLGPLQEEVPLPGWIAHHGPTHPQELVTRWFPHATGLLTLSQHAEGRPQVMIEAMAAGLPIIASAILGHRDLVRHGETGWLVNNREELAAALCAAERPNSLGTQGRDFIKRTIGTWDDCATRYKSAHERLIS